jgi:hypothetical protein
MLAATRAQYAPTSVVALTSLPSAVSALRLAGVLDAALVDLVLAVEALGVDPQQDAAHVKPIGASNTGAARCSEPRPSGKAGCTSIPHPSGSPTTRAEVGKHSNASYRPRNSEAPGCPE